MPESDLIFLLGILSGVAAFASFAAWDLRRCAKAMEWFSREQQRMSDLEDRMYAQAEEPAGWHVEHTKVQADDSAYAVSEA